MSENVPLADVYVDAGMASKYDGLLKDIGESALRILLTNHVMERKHLDLEKKYKDAAGDVEKWRHKATGLVIRLTEALSSKDLAEKASKGLEAKLAT